MWHIFLINLKLFILGKKENSKWSALNVDSKGVKNGISYIQWLCYMIFHFWKKLKHIFYFIFFISWRLFEKRLLILKYIYSEKQLNYKLNSLVNTFVHEKEKNEFVILVQYKIFHQTTCMMRGGTQNGRPFRVHDQFC